jgi:hypothetical protein
MVRETAGNHLVEEGTASRVSGKKAPTSKSTDWKKIYGVKAADLGITRAGENEQRER